MWPPCIGITNCGLDYGVGSSVDGVSAGGVVFEVPVLLKNCAISATLVSKPEIAIPLYESFVQQMEIELGKKIQTGQFGADMKVGLVNDGPVTIIIDTKNKE